MAYSVIRQYQKTLHVPSKERTKKQQRLVWLGYGILLVALMTLGVLFQDVTYGRIFLVIYGIIAVITRVPSSDTLKMALISLICVPILSVLDDKQLAQNFAEYAFLLLSIGVICTAIELLTGAKKSEM